MPPWPADVEYSHFIGEKRLTDNQIEILQNWVKMVRLQVISQISYYPK